MRILVAILLSVSVMPVFAQSKVAMVKLIRGEADVLNLGKTSKLKVDDWVENGSIIKTAEKSFVKLIFIDKSQMNVGPSSEMKIESFSGKDSGVIDLVKGKIRSQVTKDYLQINKDKSKLFIKTQNAVMGVRGTDFMISTNGKNTSTVLFEGEVVFNKLEGRGSISSKNLEEIVERGVRMFPGEFSVMEANKPIPTVPALLNIQQREHLEKNEEMNADRTPGNAGSEQNAKSVVPEGLTGQLVSNNASTLKSEVSELVRQDDKSKNSASSSDPEGYIKGNLVKPANGSFVHIDSGVIIPPGPSAVLDGNTNTFIPGHDSGRVATDGSYIPPKNIEITNDGKILVAINDPSGNIVVKEVPPPSPVISTGSVSLSQIGTTVTQTNTTIGTTGTSSSTSTTSTTTAQTSDIPLPTAGSFDTRFAAPTGGITNVNDPTRQSTFVDTTIIVNPK